MAKRAGLVCFLLLAALFAIVNRGAYKGFFTDDDFDHLSWTRNASAAMFGQGPLTPRFQPNNFRPAGHLFHPAQESLFGFGFPKYVGGLQLLHLLNVWLVWLLARRLGARPLPAAAACLFFALHMGFFEAVWKPAYIFDVLCATFSLLSILSYARGRWILSFICFWLAYKAKEPAVMLPFVLACYEIWFGSRKWKPLIPFFLASFSFGLQGLLLNPNHDNAYTFRFTAGALAQTGVFYAGRVAAVAVFFLLWLPLDLHELRLQRREKLARDNDARAWVTTWDRYARGNTPPDTVIYSGEPADFGSWGIIGAIKCSYHQAPPGIQYADSPVLPAGADHSRIAFASWNSSLHKRSEEHTSELQ